jgi:hypothetical protein
MRLAVIILLVLTGCTGTFNPDLGDHGSEESGTYDPSATASLSSTSVGSTNDASTTQNSESNGPGTEDPTNVSDASESSSDEGDSSESETTAALPPGCGDGEQSDQEDCDGDDLAGQTCELRGMPGGGMLGCFEDCTFDVSACSLGGAQPEDGLWSSCVSYEECPAGPEWECEDNFCSKDCEHTSECGPSPGGTAVAECRLLAPDNPEQGARCYLNCEDGKSCPANMVCWGGAYCRSAG